MALGSQAWCSCVECYGQLRLHLRQTKVSAHYVSAATAFAEWRSAQDFKPVPREEGSLRCPEASINALAAPFAGRLRFLSKSGWMTSEAGESHNVRVQRQIAACSLGSQSPRWVTLWPKAFGFS